jgi:hypothetical protein
MSMRRLVPAVGLTVFLILTGSQYSVATACSAPVVSFLQSPNSFADTNDPAVFLYYGTPRGSCVLSVIPNQFYWVRILDQTTGVWGPVYYFQGSADASGGGYIRADDLIAQRLCGDAHPHTYTFAIGPAGSNPEKDQLVFPGTYTTRVTIPSCE